VPIPSRRRILAATIAATTALAMAGAPAAQAAKKPKIKIVHQETQPAFSYQDAIRQFVRVQSPADADNDGKPDMIRVDIIRPKESDSGLKVPVIMDESPYYDNLGRGNESETKTYDSNGNPLKFPLYYDNYFVPRGYAVLNVDMDGTTKSDGCPTSGGSSDVLGGKAVIDWLNGRAKAFDAAGNEVTASWSNGHAGMIGKSYDGTLANAVASTGVQGLDTIVPISAISSWYDYSRMNGVKYFDGEEDGLAATVDTDDFAKCAAVRDQLATGEDDAHGNYNTFWNERDYRAGSVGNASNVHASVFAVQGLNDLNVKPNHFSTWWNALAQRDVPRKVWLSQYGHVDPFDFRRDAWVDTLHQWFDYWLLGVDNGIMDQPRADLEVGPDQWVTQADWPAPGTTNTVMHPETGGVLGSAASSGTAKFTDTASSESSLVASPTTSKSFRLAYTTPALAGNLRISGTPTVNLKLKSTKSTATLGALLVDYGTDTRVNYLGAGSGVKTLSTEDCNGDSTADDDACYLKVATDTISSDVNVVARGFLDAQNRSSLSQPSPLTPGTYYSVSWNTLPQDYTFKAGHRLALILTGTDEDVIGDSPTGASVTIDLAGSSVTLPVVGSTPSFAKSASALTADRQWRGPAKVVLPVQPRDFR
jgi:X-Pro dipeptidyl-peptidase